MRILNDTPYRLGIGLSRVHPGRLTATFVVKATFDLHPDGPATPADDQLMPAGDEFVDDDPALGLRYPSDLVPEKPRADLLLAGHCHVPGPDPLPGCPVTFGVGSHRRTLSVVGPRVWKRTLGIARISDPEPFRSLPLGWAQAFGGPGNEWNPVGCGNGKVEEVDDQPLPSVEDPDHLVTGARSKPRPASFAPVPRECRPRRGKEGTYKGKWLKERWPALPEDFDWTYFNSAPEEMQLEGYLRGDEPLLFEHLHPDHPTYTSALPGVRARILVERTDAEEGALQELPLHLDTLFADMDAERLILLWRGTVDVPDDELSDVATLVILEDPLSASRSLADCARRRDELLAAELPPEEPEVVEEEPSVEAELLAAGIDVEKTFADMPEGDPEADKEAIRAFCEKHDVPESEFKEFLDPNTRERVVERHAAGESFEGESMRDLDLSGLDLTGLRAEKADLTGATLSGATLTGATLSGANLRQVDLTGADLTGATLDECILLEARLDDAALVEASLGRTQLRGATLVGARLTGATADAADLSGSDLTRADASDATLTACDLTGSVLDGARFGGATLDASDFSGARGEAPDFTGASLAGSRFGADTHLVGARFEEIRAMGVIFDQASVPGARFRASQLTRGMFMKCRAEGADFTLCRLRYARFDGARLARAVFTQADVFQGSFEGADLTDTDLRDASLYEVEFFESVRDGALTDGADLNATKLR